MKNILYSNTFYFNIPFLEATRYKGKRRRHLFKLSSFPADNRVDKWKRSITSETGLIDRNIFDEAWLLRKKLFIISIINIANERAYPADPR